MVEGDVGLELVLASTDSDYNIVALKEDGDSLVAYEVQAILNVNNGNPDVVAQHKIKDALLEQVALPRCERDGGDAEELVALPLDLLGTQRTTSLVVKELESGDLLLQIPLSIYDFLS